MQWFKANVGWLVVVFLCTITLILWLPDNTGLTIMSASQITGLLGLTLFSIALVLSGRFRFTEKLFGGMNRVYIAHHLIGGLAFLALLAHPLLIAATYLPISIRLAAQQLLPGPIWAQNFGIAALLLLMTLLIFTYYVNVPYQIWRFTHKFMGLAFFLGGLHSLFIHSSITRIPLLRDYLLVLCLAALVIYSYRTLLGRFLVKRFTYVVKSAKNIGNQTIEIQLYPATTAMAYLPGQFLFISFPNNPLLTEVHPFSISSAPAASQLRISVKALGDYTTRLLDLKPGDVAQIEGPFGSFTYSNYPNHNQVWVAGGIGITPFLGMAQDLKSDYSISLYYCAKDQSEAVYLNQFQSLPNLKIIPFFSSVQGRISAEVFKKDLGEKFLNSDYFICGPPAMMTSLRHQLNKCGISYYHIHTENFSIN